MLVSLLSYSWVKNIVFSISLRRNSDQRSMFRGILQACFHILRRISAGSSGNFVKMSKCWAGSAITVDAGLESREGYGCDGLSFL